jgi:hypothetical protein
MLGPSRTNFLPPPIRKNMREVACQLLLKLSSSESQSKKKTVFQDDLTKDNPPLAMPVEHHPPPL